MRSRRPTRRQFLWTVAIGCLLVALAVFVFLGYRLGWQWTGFPSKRLFDWIQILVIPVAVAIGTFVLNRAAKRRDDEAQQAQKQREEAIEARHAEEASLQAYLDYISGLLTDPDRPLRRSHEGDNLSVVVRAQTLTALGRLKDGRRKASVLRFLYEAGLIGRNRPIIVLVGADLSGAELPGAFLIGTGLSQARLYRAFLSGAFLRGADLSGADLSGAVLRRADLSGAVLSVAVLRGADLSGADLSGAFLLGTDLRGADLSGADLSGADLRGAFLTDAEITEEQLGTALTLERATMPDGSKPD